MFLLDTNAIISVLNEQNPALSERFDAEIALSTPIYLSVIVLFELRYGIAKSVRRETSERILAHFLKLPLSIAAFEEDDAAHAGEIRGYLAQAGTPIGPYDLLIAAQAHRVGAVLVTANRREFDRVPGLMVTDWGA